MSSLTKMFAERQRIAPQPPAGTHRIAISREEGELWGYAVDPQGETLQEWWQRLPEGFEGARRIGADWYWTRKILPENF